MRPLRIPWRKAPCDRRVILLSLYLGFWLLLAISIGVRGWNRTWSDLRLPTMSPAFADLRSVQGALESRRLGLDPRVENPGDPWKRSMSYPAVWVQIARTLRWDRESCFLAFALASIVAYLSTCLFLLARAPSVTLLLGCLSTASLLVVERGNNDMVAFVLVFAAVSVGGLVPRAVLWGLGVVLKLYPAAALPGVFHGPRAQRWAAAASLLYAVATWREIRLLSAANTARGPYAYGIGGLVHLWYYMQGRAPLPIEELLLHLAVLAGSVAAAWWLQARWGRHWQPQGDPWRRALFQAGAGIFAFSYAVTRNWDYRLIFLLFCIPHVCRSRDRTIRAIGLLTILGAMNSLLLGTVGLEGMLASLLLKHAAFILILALLMRECNPLELVAAPVSPAPPTPI